MTLAHVTERFTPEERAALAPHFTNLEGPVFALVGLPEAVKGAMFARYSRTTKSLRRLFLDEFAGDLVGRRGCRGRSLDRGQRTRRTLVRVGVRGVRRRLGGPARRRAPRLRAVVAAAREGSRVGTPRRLPRAIDPLHAIRRQAGRRVAGDPSSRARRQAGGYKVRGVPRRGVHDVRPHVRADARVVRAALPEATSRQ